MRSVTKFLVILIASTVIVLLLPIILFIAVFSHWRETRRLRRYVKSARCQNCNSVLGEAAIALADKAWAERLREMRMQHGETVRFRLVREIDVICPHCGAAYAFIKEAGAFRLAPRSGKLQGLWRTDERLYDDENNLDGH